MTEREPGQFPFVQVISLLSFLNATFIHLFVYCYVGDKLIEEVSFRMTIMQTKQNL